MRTSLVLVPLLVSACARVPPRWEERCPWLAGLDADVLKTLETENLDACDSRVPALDNVGTDAFNVASGTVDMQVDGETRGPWRIGVRTEIQGEVVYLMGCIRGAVGNCLSLDLQMYIGQLVDSEPLTLPPGVANGPDPAFQGLIDINHTPEPRTLDLATPGNVTGEVVIDNYAPADGLLSGSLDVEAGEESNLPDGGPGQVTATFDLEW